MNSSLLSRFLQKSAVNSFITCERSINRREINNATKVYRGALRVFIIHYKTFPAARSRALFARHTGRMTTYITPYVKRC